MKQKADGYYIKFIAEVHKINKYGTLDNWPGGLFDSALRIMTEIFMASIKKRKSEEDNKNLRDKIK